MKFFQAVFIGAAYLLLCLIIGEQHPFSRVEMYSEFPKTSHAFYLSRKDSSLIPLKKYFHYSSSNLAHNYSSICNQLQNQLPQSRLSSEAAKMLWQQLKPYQYMELDLDSVQLCELNFAYDNNKLKLTRRVLDEEAIKKP